VKNLLPSILTLLVLSCLAHVQSLPGTARALGTNATTEVQEKAMGKPGQSTDSMATFWDNFKAAVIKGDKETVAALSQFPISLNDGMTPIRTKAQFMKRYGFLFSGETNAAKCFPKAKPEVEPATKKRPREFTIGCAFASGGGEEEPFEYRFTLTRSGWRFTSFTNVNE